MTILDKLKVELVELKKRFPFANFEILTPELATKYVTTNTKIGKHKNRTPNRKNIEKLKRTLHANKWRPEISALCFDIYNALIDGQQRCYAVIETGISIITKVERGHDPDSFIFFDGGKTRTYTDTISALILSDGSQVSKPKIIAGGIIFRYNMCKKIKHIDKDQTLTNSEVADMVISDEKFYINPIPKIISWHSTLKTIKETLLAAFYYYQRETNNTPDIDSFLNILCHRDTNIPIIKQFREDLAENKGRSRDHKKMLDSDIMKKLCILFREHKHCTLNTMKKFKPTDLDNLKF
jgi:hypothetical protein